MKSKAKTKTEKILSDVGHELRVNPPKQLIRTAKKFGAERAGKQRVAILLNKARESGARIPKAQPRIRKRKLVRYETGR